MFEGLKILPIVLAVVADMVIGSLWYSPFLFGNYWMKEMGYSKDDVKGVGKAMGFIVVLSIIMSVVLAIVLKNLNVVTIDSAIETAFLLWLGFVVPVSGKAVLFEKTKLTVFSITASYHLIAMIVMAIVLVVWK